MSFASKFDGGGFDSAGKNCYCPAEKTKLLPTVTAIHAKRSFVILSLSKRTSRREVRNARAVFAFLNIRKAAGKSMQAPLTCMPCGLGCWSRPQSCCISPSLLFVVKSISAKFCPFEFSRYNRIRRRVTPCMFCIDFPSLSSRSARDFRLGSG